MKKIIILSLFSLFFSLRVFAQEAPGIYFGLNGGLAKASVFKLLDSFDGKSYGADFLIKLSKSTRIALDLFYKKKSFDDLTYTEDGLSYKATMSDTTMGAGLRWMLGFFHLRVGYVLVDSDIKITQDSTSLTVSQNGDQTGYYGGASLVWSLGKAGRWSIPLEYNIYKTKAKSASNYMTTYEYLIGLRVHLF